MFPLPSLMREEREGIAFYSDPALIECGVVFGFSERGGGVSGSPYASLNLGSHVGDDPDVVAENRRRFARALFEGRYDDLRGLFVPEQVHGDRIAYIGDAGGSAGCAKAATVSQSLNLRGTDALITSEPYEALLLCFADCVPVVLVAPGPAIAVVHAGWKGALASLPGSAAHALARHAACEPTDINAYIGPHIQACCYETSEEILGRFVDRFGEGCRSSERSLDLDSAVRTSLCEGGCDPARIASVGLCTSCESDRFFSYRAEGGICGRHGALACILP